MSFKNKRCGQVKYKNKAKTVCIRSNAPNSFTCTVDVRKIFIFIVYVNGKLHGDVIISAFAYDLGLFGSFEPKLQKSISHLEAAIAVFGMPEFPQIVPNFP